MNSYLAIAILLAASATMFLLPLIPAIVELKSRTDALPLKVIQEHAGEIRFFSDGFRTYLKTLGPTLEESMVSGKTARTTMPDGAEYLVLGSGEEALALPLQGRDDICPFGLATRAALMLPASVTFSRDIYVGGNFFGGAENQYRAILGDKDVYLGRGSSVMRWVHAAGEFRSDENCSLYGRISSDSAISLHSGCSFMRLNAPRILTGPDSPKTEVSAEGFPNHPRSFGRRVLRDGDFELAAGEEFSGDLVVRGKLCLRSGAKVWGSVKSGADMTVESDVVVSGSLMSGTKMHIGRDCAISGPVIAERELELEAGARCGSAESPTTVSAPRIKSEPGVVVFGTLWARERGLVTNL